MWLAPKLKRPLMRIHMQSWGKENRVGQSLVIQRKKVSEAIKK